MPEGQIQKNTGHTWDRCIQQKQQVRTRMKSIYSGLDGKKDYRRSKRSKRPGRLKEWRRRWELRKEDRRKKKYKRKAKKSHKKENRRRARIDFIRKFLPNYKRTKNIPFSELSDEQAAEMIKQQQKNYLYYTVNSTALFYHCLSRCLFTLSIDRIGCRSKI